MEYREIMLLTDIPLRLDKRAVLASVDCHEDSPAYAEMAAVFDRLAMQAEQLICPQAAFVFDRQATPTISEICDCEAVVFCLVTIGNAITEKATALFQAGLYSEGLIADAIANYALYDIASQLYQRLVCEARSAGLGLTRRISPGEGELAVAFQRDILVRFSTGGLGVTITEGAMLNPVKSMAYVYGADARLPVTGVDHDCSFCSRENCQLRMVNSPPEYVRLTITGGRQDITIQAQTDQTVMTALTAAGIALHTPCGGRGSCGKCKVKVISGLVSSERIAEGVYLACRACPLTDCVIDIGSAEEFPYQTTADFLAGSRDLNDTILLIPASLTTDDWKTGESVTRLLDAKLGKRHAYSLKALRKLADAQAHSEVDPAQLQLAVRQGTVVDLLDSHTRPVGVAIDIGTTTVVLALVDLLTGGVIKTYSLLNSQRRYGADIISRILYSGSDPKALRTAICTDILTGIRELGADSHALLHVVITGNTVMLHFLLGLPAEALGSYPFQPVTTDLQELSFVELFGDPTIDCLVTILPGISAFVGADIAAGLLQCGFGETDAVSLLLDIGTNGEIAIGSKQRILCSATAAGPAFEGANIACGTGSIDGAIAGFQLANGQRSFQTIGGKAPVGICGSGIIDIMAACVAEHAVDSTGKFAPQLFPAGVMQIAQKADDSWLVFTQKDVRELQLAKSALRAGMEVLMKRYGSSYSDITNVYLAGSFGAHINIDSAVCIGLLPEELKYKVIRAGNSALGGAIRYLLNQSARQTLTALLAVANSIDLAADSEFNELFMKNMYLRQ